MSNYFEIALPSFNSSCRVPAMGPIMTLIKFGGEPTEILL